MIKRFALLAATGLMAAACASNPAPAGGVSSSGAVPLTPGASSGTATIANLATSTHWVAEEKLMPEDPVLALVNTGSTNADAAQGVVIKCNAANGKISVYLGKQAAARVGQSATYKLRTGAGARDLDGRFEANKKSADADFVFPITSADLMAMSQLDLVSVLGDQGEVQWAFVKDPAAAVQAKYVGSLKDLGTASRDFLTFCNPK
jgi:hypothetical protein